MVHYNIKQKKDLIQLKKNLIKKAEAEKDAKLIWIKPINHLLNL